MLNDLSNLSEVIEKINEIVTLEMPFSRMTELASLVFQARGIKEAILKEICEKTKKALEKNRDAINKELREALELELSDEQRQRIKGYAEELNATYESWLGSLLPTTTNMEAYITSSQSSLSRFKELIARIITEKSAGTERIVRSKRVKVIDCVPVANKKVKTKEDIEKVVSSIRERLLGELSDNDEINLD